MPCLNPLSRVNPRWMPSKKNGGIPEICPDPRLYRVQFDCGICSECRRKRGMHWNFRMQQEMRRNRDKAHFVTLTFSDASLGRLRAEFPASKGYTDNDIATVAVRRFLERYRKKHKVSLRHFFVTELGGKSDRIHLHGVILGCLEGSYKRGRFHVDIPGFTSIWKYGYTFIGWCTEATISYIMKYITKVDHVHPDFRPKLLLSPGIGKCYVSAANVDWHHSAPGGIWYVVTSTGHKISIPRYYRNYVFSDEEREARVIYILENPPPFVFRSQTYKDKPSYLAAVSVYYRHTLRSGNSFSRFKRINIVESLEFNL